MRNNSVPDLFVSFSSVSALNGALGKGMADYAAANAFLNAFAGIQRNNGVPGASSINWGVWKGIGMGKRTPLAKASGILPFSVEEALEAFSFFLSFQFPSSVILFKQNKEMFEPEWFCEKNATTL